MTYKIKNTSKISRRSTLLGLGASAGALASVGAFPGAMGFAQAQSSAPIKIGFQKHATGIGAAYGRWYDATTTAAVKRINDNGGINGRPVEVVVEDDGTDPSRGAEVLEKFANQHNCDVAFGTLFSHVVIGSAPRAAELKLPYFVVSEGHHVASGGLNRYTLQPGITDVKSQVQSMAPFVANNLGKKVTMIFPDFAFGHDHRDFFTKAVEAQGGQVIAHIAVPPTETTFTRYFPSIPRDTDVIYHVMVGPAVLTFVKELGEFQEIFNTTTDMVSVEQPINTNNYKLKETVKSLIEKVGVYWNCKMCGQKSAHKVAIKRHIESKHTTGGSHPCKVCGKIFKYSNSKNSHMSTLHAK
jgi:branched-chain amino acid transport system substrate-binding protein